MWYTEEQKLAGHLDPNSGKITALNFFHIGGIWLLLMCAAVYAIGFVENVDLKSVWTTLMIGGFGAQTIAYMLAKQWHMYRHSEVAATSKAPTPL